jgi:hypothetical protein
VGRQVFSLSEEMEMRRIQDKEEGERKENEAKQRKKGKVTQVQEIVG